MTRSNGEGVRPHGTVGHPGAVPPPLQEARQEHGHGAGEHLAHVALRQQLLQT